MKRDITWQEMLHEMRRCCMLVFLKGSNQVDARYQVCPRSGEELECGCGNKFDGVDRILTRIDKLFGISWNITMKSLKIF